MSKEPDRLRARRAFGLLLYYAIATLLGGVLFAGLLRVNAAMGTGILFYRGLVALVATAIVLFLASAFVLPRLRTGLDLQAADALGGAIVATSVLGAAFVLGPVTVDRSISVFMLSQFESAGGPLTESETQDRFVRIYVGEWGQIGRRLAEQQASGNLELTPEGWLLTNQGRRFMSIARAMSELSGGDPRFVGRKD